MLIVAIASMFIVLLLTAAFVNQREDRIAPDKKLSQEARFEVRSGETRDKAIELSKKDQENIKKAAKKSSESSAPGDHADVSDTGENSGEENGGDEAPKENRASNDPAAPENVPSLTPPEDTEEKKPDLVDTALQDIPQNQVEEKLKKLLSEPLPVEEQSKAHEALAQFYENEDPPKTEEARTEYEKALELNDDPEERRNVAINYATFLLNNKDGAAAQAIAEKVLGESAALTGSRMQLRLLQARAFESLNDPQAAEKAYRETILEASSPVDGKVSPEARDAVRTASLRLVRLSRAQGNEDTARQLAADLKKQLDAIPLETPEEGEPAEETTHEESPAAPETHKE